MEFSTWLEAKGFDASALSKEQKAALQAAWRAEQNPAPAPAPEPEPAADDKPKSGSHYSEVKAAIDAENERQEGIRTLALKAAENYRGDSQKTRQLWQLADAAVADERKSVRDFQLDVMK